MKEFDSKALDKTTEDIENGKAVEESEVLTEAVDSIDTIEKNDKAVNKNVETGSVYKHVKKPDLWKRFVKRSFDILLSFLAIVFLAPFFILFTPIVAIAMNGNPFFVQYRVGKNNKIFPLIKFRTMTNAKDKEGNFLPDEVRLTKFGKLLRKLSIDELPELFNIFIGQMSIVGPRPLLKQYLPLYNDFQAQRHIVRPGLTGLAQINGRNATTWQERFENDIEYIEKMGFFFDLKIIFLTIGKVFKSKGISQEGQATMEFFTGNDTPKEEVKGE